MPSAERVELVELVTMVSRMGDGKRAAAEFARLQMPRAPVSPDGGRRRTQYTLQSAASVLQSEKVEENCRLCEVKG